MNIHIRRTVNDRIHIHGDRQWGAFLSPTEAEQAGMDLLRLAEQIRRDAARAVCAVEGHMWWGFNAHMDWPGGKVHIRYCERDDCDLREQSDGWRDTVYPPPPDEPSPDDHTDSLIFHSEEEMDAALDAIPPAPEGAPS